MSRIAAAAATPTRTLQMSAALLDALAELANQKRDAGSIDGRRGPRVTIRALVEEAVLTRWPDLRARAAVTSDPAAGGASDEELARASEQAFGAVLAAVYGADRRLGDGAIDALKGSVVGNFGERIGLRELARHLREAVEPIGSMDELVRSYEGRARRARGDDRIVDVDATMRDNS